MRLCDRETVPSTIFSVAHHLSRNAVSVSGKENEKFFLRLGGQSPVARLGRKNSLFCEHIQKKLYLCSENIRKRNG